MKSSSFQKLNRKSALVILGFAGLSLLTAGGREGSDGGRDRPDGVSGGNRIPVTEGVEPIFGSDDKPAAKKEGGKDGAANADRNGRSPESISAEAGRGMLTQFKRAQAAELSALEHRNKLEYRELKASQVARRREWETKETEFRHKFFAEHRNGPDRRAYIQNFMARRRDLDQTMKDELKQKQIEQDSHVAGLRADQTAKLKLFKDALDRGERPAGDLWPKSGT